MAARTLWVGLDVGADTMAVCATDNRGTVEFEHLIPTNAAVFHQLMKAEKRRIKLIGLESGAAAIPLTRSLRKMGYRVAVFDSRKTSKFLAIRKNKTDKNDARGIAEIARVGRVSVSEVRVKAPECQQLRSMRVTRKKLVTLRTTVENSMRSLFRLNGGRLKKSTTAAALKANVTNELKILRKLAKIDLTEDIGPLLGLSEMIRTHVEVLDKRLAQLAEDHPVCRNFLEITGVGPICALSFYSAVEDPGRFKRSADIGPFLGMTPVVRQSGQSTSRRPISKMGDAMTRSYLVSAALNHLRFGTSAISVWGRGLRERTSYRQARVAVARKLAVMMIAMWKSGERYDPQRGSLQEEALLKA